MDTDKVDRDGNGIPSIHLTVITHRDEGQTTKVRVNERPSLHRIGVGPSSACRRGDMMTYGPWWWCLVLHGERPVPSPLARRRRRRRTGCQGRLCVMYVSLMNFQHVSKKLQRSSSSSSSSWYHRRVVTRIVCKCSAMRRPKVADHEPTNSARTRFLIISRKYGTFRVVVVCLFYGGDEIWLISFTLYFIAFCARLLLVLLLILFSC